MVCIDELEVKDYYLVEFNKIKKLHFKRISCGEDLELLNKIIAYKRNKRYKKELKDKFTSIFNKTELIFHEKTITLDDICVEDLFKTYKEAKEWFIIYNVKDLIKSNIKLTNLENVKKHKLFVGKLYKMNKCKYGIEYKDEDAYEEGYAKILQIRINDILNRTKIENILKNYTNEEKAIKEIKEITGKEELEIEVILDNGKRFITNSFYFENEGIYDIDHSEINSAYWIKKNFENNNISLNEVIEFVNNNPEKFL